MVHLSVDNPMKGVISAGLLVSAATLGRELRLDFKSEATKVTIEVNAVMAEANLILLADVRGCQCLMILDVDLGR